METSKKLLQSNLKILVFCAIQSPAQQKFPQEQTVNFFGGQTVKLWSESQPKSPRKAQTSCQAWIVQEKSPIALRAIAKNKERINFPTVLGCEQWTTNNFRWTYFKPCLARFVFHHNTLIRWEGNCWAPAFPWCKHQISVLQWEGPDPNVPARSFLQGEDDGE